MFSCFLDFDGDDILSTSDLEEVINRLTGDENRLDVEQMKHLINNVRHLYSIVNSERNIYVCVFVHLCVCSCVFVCGFVYTHACVCVCVYERETENSIILTSEGVGIHVKLVVI